MNPRIGSEFYTRRLAGALQQRMTRFLNQDKTEKFVLHRVDVLALREYIELLEREKKLEAQNVTRAKDCLRGIRKRVDNALEEISG